MALEKRIRNKTVHEKTDSTWLPKFVSNILWMSGQNAFIISLIIIKLPMKVIKMFRIFKQLFSQGEDK